MPLSIYRHYAIIDMGKEQRLDKLAKEKEERTEEREKAKEERQRLRDMNKVHGDPTIIERDGKKLYQYKTAKAAPSTRKRSIRLPLPA